MEFFENWCICGKQIIDYDSSLYCCDECRNTDNSNVNKHQSKKLATQNPPSNLHFSITINPNFYEASNSNSRHLNNYYSSSFSSASSSSYDSLKLSSSFTSAYTIDQGFNENYDYIYTRTNRYSNKFNNDDEEDVEYSSYYSTSAPIDIPIARTQPSDPSLEPNQGTFGREKSLFS